MRPAGRKCSFLGWQSGGASKRGVPSQEPTYFPQAKGYAKLAGIMEDCEKAHGLDES